MSKKANKIAKSAGLRSSTNAMDSFRRLMREGALVYEMRRSFILQSDDPEHVHQARVALRRMRSLLRGFDTMLAGQVSDELGELLANRFRELGPLRDADVHAETADGNGDLARKAADLRAQIRKDFRASKDLSLKSQIDSIMHDTVRVLRGPRRQRLAEAPVTIMASRALQIAWSELLSFGPDLDVLSPDELHQFRKRAKDMRYLVDFFGALFPANHKPLLKRMSQMQDALGLVNDLVVMRGKATESQTAELPKNAARMESDARKKAAKAWKKLTAEPAWWCDIPLETERQAFTR